MYVIAGVSGHTGKVAAETLLAQGKPVRVLVRDASKGEPWKKRGAEVAVADLADAEALGAALRGATGFYVLLPPNPQSTDVRRDSGARTKAIVSAIQAAKPKHVVLLSSIGAQHDHGNGPIASLHDAEVALAKAGAAATFLRAAYFMENWGGSLFALDSGALPTFLRADRAIPMVASRDIGTTAAKALLEGGTGQTVVELGGPREYSPNDVAAALAKILGKSITAQQGPEEAMVPALTGAGLNAHWAQLYQEMTHGINTGHVDWERGSARAVRGATDLEVVLRALVGR